MFLFDDDFWCLETQESDRAHNFHRVSDNKCNRRMRPAYQRFYFMNNLCNVSLLYSPGLASSVTFSRRNLDGQSTDDGGVQYE